TIEQMVSPSEVGTIQVMPDYEFQDPEGAMEPQYAQWDPHFAGTPNDDWGGAGLRQAPTISARNLGNNSYAHMPLAGARKQFWRTNYNASLPIVCNRGPVYDQRETPDLTNGDEWKLSSRAEGIASDALLIHGPETRWAGNIAFGDGHLDFSQKPDPDVSTFVDRNRGTEPINQPDNIFVDEENEGSAAQDRKNNRNAVLRLFRDGIPVDEEFDPTNHLDPGRFAWADGIPRIG
ncbi:MAG: hypothetical protein ACE5FA_14590, partial [Dehalococcoidia bacterium]